MITQVIFKYTDLSVILTQYFYPNTFSMPDTSTAVVSFNIDIPPDTSIYDPFRVNAINPNSTDYFRVDSYVLDDSSGYNVYTLTGGIESL